MTFKADGRGCDCVELEIVTTNEAVRRKHGDLLGKYTKMEKIKGLALHSNPDSELQTFFVKVNLFSEILYFSKMIITIKLKPKIR